MGEILIAYVPFVHRGYVSFFNQHPDSHLCILGPDFLNGFPHLTKNLPALEPAQVEIVINALIASGDVLLGSTQVLTPLNFHHLLGGNDSIVLPREDVSEEFVQQHLQGRAVAYGSIFLRRDKFNATTKQDVTCDGETTTDEFARTILNLADQESQRSSDFFRRVGAAVVVNGEVIAVGYNRHLPSEQTPYAWGDPRGNFHKGTGQEYTTAQHAELTALAQVSRLGISTAGADIYVTTFPCPTCAMQIATSGFKRLFFRDGYALLEGEDVLRKFNVEIVRVI